MQYSVLVRSTASFNPCPCDPGVTCKATTYDLTMTHITPSDLPKKQLAAGVILLNEQRHLLLVKPTYRDGWLLPGGIVEVWESPHQAALREVLEELNLSIKIERLLCIDYQKNETTLRENIQFVFYGGILTAHQQQSIQLPSSELSECRFIALHDAINLLNPYSARRVPIAVKALEQKKTFYLENGIIVC